MKKLMKNIKLMIAVSTMLAMFAIAPVVYGGISWTGIDPILMIDGHQYNVRFEWPSEFDCAFTGPMELEVKVPPDVSAELIEESNGNFGGCSQETVTTIVVDKRLKNKLKFAGFVHGASNFDVNIKVDVDGMFITEAHGLANRVVKLMDVFMDWPYDEQGDPLVGDGETEYTFEKTKGKKK